MPPYPKPVSQAQRGAMHAAAQGDSTLGIPKKVGAEFVKGDKGGKLPAYKKPPSQQGQVSEPAPSLPPRKTIRKMPRSP